MDLSVVIPVKNEADNIAPLVGEICAALEGLVDYEIIFVDDGSEDATGAEFFRLAAKCRNCGCCGMPKLRAERGDPQRGQGSARPWIATLDGDGQNDPADIPALWRLAANRAAEAAADGRRASPRPPRHLV